MAAVASAKRFADHYWHYSLAEYAQTDVRALCLRLQDDYQANVNLLLLGGFVGCSGHMLGADDWTRIAAAMTPFNRRYTQRIRNLRKRLQRLAGSHITAADCYRQLKVLELKAEQLEQQIIAISCDNGVRSSLLRRQNCAVDNQILHNLLAYHASWSERSAAGAKVVGELAAALRRNGEIKGNQSQQ